MVPFGFGLPFITNYRMKTVVIFGALFSITIELMQWLTGFMAKMTFRIADVNDVIFNTVGVAIGYMLFVGFLYVYHRMSPRWEGWANLVFRYIADRVLMEK